ncbi:hypothetical protein Q8A67_024207 [Cirrhinus molitorella]|uniref:Uncharacterized protein n=1 Tax=Cirrhinus molitorella TaxID=172907 RepID=A0AA88NZP4_9TELE|nr:hypothetical protein Q8A67_024207 [Cirrhinus molitorella]
MKSPDRQTEDRGLRGRPTLGLRSERSCNGIQGEGVSNLRVDHILHPSPSCDRHPEPITNRSSSRNDGGLAVQPCHRPFPPFPSLQLTRFVPDLRP